MCARVAERLSALTTCVFAAWLPAGENAVVIALSSHAQRTRAKVATMKTGIFATSLVAELTSSGHFANGQAVWGHTWQRHAFDWVVSTVLFFNCFVSLSPLLTLK